MIKEAYLCRSELTSLFHVKKELFLKEKEENHKRRGTWSMASRQREDAMPQL